MLEGAYVHIFGTLNEDIVINETNNGNRFGILSVSVNRFIEKSSMEINNRTDVFCVFIWNETILNKHWQSLRRGKKVYIFGELRTIKQTVVCYDMPCNAITLDINNRFKVEVLK